MGLRVGLTGGIGSGKSSVLAALARHGVPVLDADDVVHAVQRPDARAYRAIVAHFGEACLNPDGTLNRPWLRARVFTDPACRQALEAIVHPAVREAILAWCNSCGGTAVPSTHTHGDAGSGCDADTAARSEPPHAPPAKHRTQSEVRRIPPPYCVVAIPLLLESGEYAFLDRVVVVECSEAQQIARVGARSGLSEAEVRAIIATQATPEARRQAADYLIQNTGSAEALEASVEALHQRLLADAQGQAQNT